MQASFCPPITLVGEISVSRSMVAMDCHIDMAVRTGYDRLFGPGGGLGYALFGLLTIYIALLAYGFMTGRTRLTLTMMSPRIVAMVLVLAFVSFWPAYHAVFYGLLMNGPDEIAAMLLGQSGSAVLNFAETLDALFVRFAEIAMALDAEQKATGVLQSQSMPVTLFWLSGLMLLVSTLGVLILTRLTLYLLLILGPIFILLGLFPQTRGLFNGWLRTALIFALAPLLTVLGGTAALMLFVPLINTIAENPLGNAAAVQPMVILFMGSVIYAAFLATLMWVAASLVRDWQAALRDKNPDPASASAGASGATGVSYPLTVDAAQRGVSDAYARTQPLVNSITRESVSTSTSETSRTDSVAAAGLAQAARTETGQARTRGLGQSFRGKTGASGSASGRGKVVELR